MGESSSTPRFRIRLEDGAELPISSVEALARRVARGDLEPETPLYDGSTGAWIESSKASVVQFILDEMRRDGVELPPGWDTPPEVESPMGVPGEVSPNISLASEKSGGPESAESADAGSVGSPPDGEPDPLELGLTLTPPGEVALVDEEVGAAKRTVPDRKPDQSRVTANDPPVVEDSPAVKDWMTPRSAGGLFTPTVGEEEVGVGGGKRFASTPEPCRRKAALGDPAGAKGVAVVSRTATARYCIGWSWHTSG